MLMMLLFVLEMYLSELTELRTKHSLNSSFKVKLLPKINRGFICD